MTKLFIPIAALNKKITWVKQLQLLIICKNFSTGLRPFEALRPPQLRVLRPRGLKHGADYFYIIIIIIYLFRPSI